MKITIADIAARAGVSKGTVSRVLNRQAEGVGPQTRARVEAILAATGFQPSGMARGLATGRSRTIGLIIPDITNPFYPQLVLGAENSLRAAGYGLFLCNSASDIRLENQYIKLLVEKGVDGVILDSARSNDSTQLGILDQTGLPYVLLDRLITSDHEASGVYVNNCAGAEMAANLLLDAPGCSLLFVNGPAELSQSRERLAGVHAAMGAREIARDRLQVVNCDFTVHGADLLMSRMVEASRSRGEPALPFNAVFAANDQMAIGVLQALKRHGLVVPNDVELIGFDGIELGKIVDPPLTTIEQPMLDMGARSADLLLQMIGGEARPGTMVVLQPTLRPGGTTRARKLA